MFRETLPGGNKPLQLFTEDDARPVDPRARLHAAPQRGPGRRCSASSRPTSGRRQKAGGRHGGTGLYCGEQDLFCFLIDPTGWAEIDGEAFAPGFFVWNSEVGKRSVGISTFWFQAVCREPHRLGRDRGGRVHPQAHGQGRRGARRHPPHRRGARREAGRPQGRVRRRHQEGDGDEARRRRRGGDEGAQPRPASRGRSPSGPSRSPRGKGRFTIFSVVDALTRIAGELANAGDRTEADQKASRAARPRERQLKNDWRSMSTEEIDGEPEMPKANAKSRTGPEPDGGDGADRNRPVHVVRLKNIRAAVWANETDAGTRLQRHGVAAVQGRRPAVGDVGELRTRRLAPARQSGGPRPHLDQRTAPGGRRGVLKAWNEADTDVGLSRVKGLPRR